MGQERFLADAMLGKLAKWLRILGFDAHYQSAYPDGAIRRLVESEGRVLLTRCAKTLKAHDGGVLIRSDHVRDQLCQMVDEGWFRPDPDRGFRRCVVCNSSLEEVDCESVRECVPEYVFTIHGRGFRRCPSCGRLYWPGSHRKRMIEQLVSWGILERTPSKT